MLISRLRIQQFRNITRVELEPGSGLNVITGANGQGKTSLLEAMYVMSSGSSFRSAADDDLVIKGGEGFGIACWYDNNGRHLESSLEYQAISKAKQLKINQKRAAFSHEDRLKVVCFTPDDLFLIKGLPAKRRHFIDYILCQLSTDYTSNLQQYRSLIKKRNDMLRRGAFDDPVRESINPILGELGARIILARVNFINTLNEIIKPILAYLDKTSNNVDLKYAVSYPVRAERINQGVLTQAMMDRLEVDRDREKQYKRTLCGPHVDDVHFYQNGQNARLFASQGQQRNLVVCLKIAEILAFYRIKEYYPVLLLDEVLAELDEEKRARLLDYLEEAPFQSFLTSVEEMPRPMKTETNKYEMVSGRVRMVAQEGG